MTKKFCLATALSLMVAAQPALASDTQAHAAKKPAHAAKAAPKQMTWDEQVDAVFDVIDENRDGIITNQEFHNAFISGNEILHIIVNCLLFEYDKNHDGKFQRAEFHDFMNNDENLKNALNDYQQRQNAHKWLDDLVAFCNANPDECRAAPHAGSAEGAPDAQWENPVDRAIDNGSYYNHGY